MELSYRTIAANLNVALRTVYHINRLFVEMGDVVPKKAPRRENLRSLSSSDELLIIGLISDSPSSYLSDCATQLRMCVESEFLLQLCVRLYISMALLVKSCSTWQSRDHCNIAGSLWPKFKINVLS